MYLYGSIILLITCSVLYLYRYLRKTFSFFERHGVPHLEPTFLFGNMMDVILLRKSMAEVYADLYRKLEPHRFAGIYAATRPIILIRDPDLVKDVLIKDFEYFSDRGYKVDPTVEPLSNHIFTMQNDEWRHLRIKLTNAFTTGKMKMMFPLVNVCGQKFSQVIDQTSLDEPLDVKDLWGRYTTDVISSCAFGLEANSLHNPNSEFIQMGKKLQQFRFKSFLRQLQFDIPQRLVKLLRITIFDEKTQNFFGNIVSKTIDYRQKNNVKRNDLLDLLIELKNNGTLTTNDETKDEKDLQRFLDQVGPDKGDKGNMEITDQLLAAQCFIFFFAGFETTSTHLSYALLELSQNKPIQDKVRQEITQVISANNGQLTYDALNQMTYTDMVVCETLRKYPSLAMLLRRTVENYKIADSSFVIPAGTSVVVSIYGIHMDEKYYKNSHEFRPERFTQEEKSSRPKYTYLPFGEGPRYCIGARFAKMSVKVGLVYALKNSSYRISPKMKFPLEFDKNFGLLTPSNSILLDRDRV